MTHAMLTKIIINLVIFVLIVIGSIIYLKQIKIKNKGYKFVFCLYTIFWIAPMLLRSYSGTLQKAIDVNYTVIALASYGIVGIFARLFADFINFGFRSRKAFLYFASVMQIAFYIPVVIIPNTATSIIQSIGVGIGASCIGSFQLFFKEQYDNKAFETVSLLSIPPLLANFLTAPLQSLLMIGSKEADLVNVNHLKYLWLIGLIFSFIALIMIFFMRQDKTRFGSIKNPNFDYRHDTPNLLFLSIIGSIIAFIKFSNSGSVGTLHLQTLGDLENQTTEAYEGYLSVIFSLFQLIGGVLVGTYLVKRFNFISIFGMGSLVWIIYMIGSSYIKSPIGYFIIHGLNGLAYGILYNFVLGTVLSTSFKKQWITPMGIYQSILSIGIACSGIFTQMIKINLKIEFYTSIQIINYSLIGFVILSFSLYSLYWYLNNKVWKQGYKYQTFKIK